MEKKKLIINQRTIGYFLVLPAVAFMIVFVVYPVVYNVILSFQNVTSTNLIQGSRPFVGIQNYINIAKSGFLTNSLKVTLVYTVACLFFQFTIGFLLALIFTQKAKEIKRLSSFLLLAYIMPVTITAIVFKFFFQSSGLINNFLMSVGIINKNIEWLSSTKYSLLAVIIANIWCGIPFNMILLESGMINIPSEVYESSQIDGANSFQQFIWITLPLMKNSILMVLILGFVYTFKTFELIYVMTVGGPMNSSEVLSIYSYRRSFNEYNFGEGAAIAMILFLILLSIGIFYVRLLKREEDY